MIGTGFMGRTWTEVATNHVEETQVVAVAGGRRAPELGRDYGADVEPTPEALLGRTDVDLVVVATQPDTHADYVVAAGESGRHVLVEKPMTVSVAEAERMVAATEGRGQVLAVCSQHRFRASPVAAMDLIRRGEIGDAADDPGPGRDHAGRGGARRQRPLVRHGLPRRGPAACTRRQPGHERLRPTGGFRCGAPADTHKSTMAVYGFANGAMAQVWITYELPAPGLGSMMQYLITGSKGMIRLDSYDAVEVGSGDGWRDGLPTAAVRPEQRQ